jgi:uncharacterized protein YdeI (YjbR/CyaY-like superfamily)
MMKTPLNASAQVDGYVRKQKACASALQRLRRIALDAGLDEQIKWRTPVFSWQGGNVVFIGADANGCVLSFLQGALMKDPAGLLQKPGPNTRGARVIRFGDEADVVRLTSTLKAYVEEAVAMERAGVRYDYKSDAPPALPEELTQRLAENAALKKAFASLTPGRQRAYVLHFGSAKQAATRLARIDKATPRILDGLGPND